MFQKKKIIRFRLYIFFLLFVLFFIKFSTTSTHANAYKIIDIEISESYDLNFNKQNIIDSAFKIAFRELIAKITISEDKKNLNSTNLKLIKSLVDSFSIVDEKFIENKYYAKFDVDFNKKQVLNFLERENIFLSIPIEKNLLLIPILVDIEKKQMLLFSENPYYLNWNEKNEKHYLLKYILPNEDLEDINIIKKNINNIEYYNFNEIITKYDIKDYIIIIFFKNKSNLKILSKVNLNNNFLISNTVFTDVNYDEQKSLENVIKKLKTNYENQWKKINQINTSIRLPLTLLLNSKNYELVEKFEKYIAKLDLVSNYYIDNFSSEITIYKIIYNSTPDKFIQEIENKGFKLDTSYKIWRVQ
tara:strand:+ start:392 stop:1468 length:1077 start_codon:yes stop_codon:yes gene_type:complete